MRYTWDTGFESSILDALRIVLQPLASLLNRQIQAQTSARAICQNLDGACAAIRVSNTSLATYLLVDSGRVSLTADHTREPDVVVSGSFLSLLQLAGSASEDLIRKGDVELVGDVHIAAQLQKLLLLARPDAEEELSRFIGDVAAHSIGNAVRSLGEWGLNARGTMRQNVSEYLQQESQAVPSRYEVERFRTRVESLRDDVARLEAAIRRFELQSATKRGA